MFLLFLFLFLDSDDFDFDVDFVFCTYVFTLGKKQTFPNIIGELPALETLHLSANGLEQIPDTFFAKITKLRELVLTDNKLRSIPSSISSLKALSVLHLSNNTELSCLPDEMFTLGPSLNVLFLAQCPKIFATLSGSGGLARSEGSEKR